LTSTPLSISFFAKKIDEHLLHTSEEVLPCALESPISIGYDVIHAENAGTPTDCISKLMTKFVGERFVSSVWRKNRHARNYVRA